MTLLATGPYLTLIDVDGVRHEKLRPVRLFPLTDSQHWVALVDENGREAVCIEDLSILDAFQRTLLEAALTRRDFVPVIRRVIAIKRATEGHDWHVETDRGQTVFRIETDESIQSLGGTRLVIIDKAGTRYLIPDLAALDHESRRKLERYH